MRLVFLSFYMKEISIVTYEQFVRQVHQLMKIDLSQYKEAQMKRRLTSFRDKKGFSDFEPFIQALKTDRQLRYEFLDRMTINVSEFFRNLNRWQVLESKIIPQILKTTTHLKVWSAACSTGEEPYTIAIILSKFRSIDAYTIVATDIDDKALHIAKLGTYRERSFKNVPEDVKTRYFLKDGHTYVINDDLKKHIVFQKHDLLSDPFDSGFDLIVCRNVMIYFTEEAKDRLYEKFSRSLKKDGFLFVGSTEQIFDPQKYGMAREDTFFYRKR